MHAITNRDFLASLGLALTTLAISAVLVIGGYCLFAPRLHPEFGEAKEFAETTPISIRGNQFQPVIFGGGGVAGATAVITQLAKASPEDQAILLHRSIFQASHSPFLRYHIEGRNPALRVILFWQRADQPGESFFMELDYSGEGTGIQNLLRSEDWKGTITELAVGFFGDLRGEPVTLLGMGLEPYSSGRLLEVVWGEWTALSVWHQRSINRVDAIPQGGTVSPVAASSAIFALSTVLMATLFFLSTYKKIAFCALLISGLVCWIALDLLWQRRLDWQLEETRHLFAGKEMHERKLADMDGEIYRAIYHIKENLLPEPGPVIWILAEEHYAYEAHRAKYHLTPHQTFYRKHAGYTHRMMRRFGYATSGQYILAIGNVNKLSFTSENSKIRYYGHCGAAEAIFTNKKIVLYRLVTDLKRCTTAK